MNNDPMDENGNYHYGHFDAYLTDQNPDHTPADFVREVKELTAAQV